MTYTQSIKFRSFAFYNGSLKRTMVSGRNDNLSYQAGTVSKQKVDSGWKSIDRHRHFSIKN